MGLPVGFTDDEKLLPSVLSGEQEVSGAATEKVIPADETLIIFTISRTMAVIKATGKNLSC